MVLMKEAPQSVGKIDEIAKSILWKLNNMRIQSATHFSCSIGIGIDFKGIYSFDELYQRADQALYQAKQNGKACFCKKY